MDNIFENRNYNALDSFDQKEIKYWERTGNFLFFSNYPKQSHFGRIGILLHVWYRISVTRLRTKTYQKTPKFDFGDDLVISFSRQNGWKSWNLTCLSFNYDLVFTWNQIVAILVSFGSKSLWLFWCSWYGIKHGVEFLYGQNESAKNYVWVSSMFFKRCLTHHYKLHRV